MGGMKRYINPRGEGIAVDTGYAPSAGDFTEIKHNSGAVKAPVDYSDRIIGLISVPSTGVIQQSGEVTVLLQHDFRKELTAGEAIPAGSKIMWKQSTSRAYIWIGVKVAASQTVTLATNSTGGVHTVTVNGEDVDVTITSGDTPTVAAGKVVAALNADTYFKSLGLYATNSSGVITITGSRGALDNAITLAVATTDGAQTIVAGAAALASGVGYPEESCIGRALTGAAAAAATFDALLKLGV